MDTYICEIFVCFETNLFVRALLAKTLKLRRHRKAVRILWSRFELDSNTVARVAGSQSFFPPADPSETMYSNNSSGRAGRHGRTGARGPTTYKPRGPDAWRIPNLDRSTVFHRPNQTSTPSPPVGNKRPAVSAPDAGGVELQPRPLGTMSGGEGQAGWACELASQQEMISKQRNVQSQSRLWVCEWAVVVPRWI